jgi:hypothetical protein
VAFSDSARPPARAAQQLEEGNRQHQREGQRPAATTPKRAAGASVQDTANQGVEGHGSSPLMIAAPESSETAGGSSAAAISNEREDGRRGRADVTVSPGVSHDT